MIDLFYKTILTVLNENQRGKTSPLDFNLNVNQAIQIINNDLFSEFRKLNYKKSKFQATSNYGDEASNMKQAIEHYITEKSVDLVKKEGQEIFNFIITPKDYLLVNSIFSGDNELSKTDTLQFKKLIKSKRMKPNLCSAIYSIKDGGIEVFPEIKKVDLVYFRKPKFAKWTYRLVDNVETFDPSKKDFQDLDIHPMLMSKLFVETLFLCGLNIRDENIHQYIQMMKQEEIQNSQ